MIKPNMKVIIYILLFIVLITKSYSLENPFNNSKMDSAISYFNSENYYDFGSHEAGSLYVGSIETILIDNDDILWIGGRFGIVKYDGITWEFYNLNNSNLPYCILSSHHLAVNINDLKQDMFGEIYADCCSGIRKYNDGIWDNLSDSEPDLGEAHWMEFDKNGNMFFGLRNYVVTKNGTTWDSIFIGSDSYYDKAFDENGDIWISLRYHINQIKNDTIISYHPYTDSASYFRTIDIDSKGNIWTANRDELLKFDGDNWQIFNHTNSAIPDSEMYGRTYFTIDDLDNIWVYGYCGIWIYDNNSWITDDSLFSELIEYIIQSVHIDRYNNVWIYATGLTENKLYLKQRNDFISMNIKGDINKIVKDYNFIQVTPNPFNPSTTITFYLPIGETADLKIYSLSGQLIEHFKDIKRNRVVWSAKGQGSGVYVVKLITDNHVYNKKMVLMK